MKITFPKAVNPPKPVAAYGPLLGYFSAGISVIFAVVQLFRIDTLIPIVNAVLPGETGAAGVFVVVVTLAEIFSVPFLLRMKLSPLAQIVSGVFVILAPLMWTLLSIWSITEQGSIGQLGEFFNVTSTPLVAGLNVLWLSGNFVTLWALGYNKLSARSLSLKHIKKPRTS